MFNSRGYAEVQLLVTVALEWTDDLSDPHFPAEFLSFPGSTLSHWTAHLEMHFNLTSAWPSTGCFILCKVFQWESIEQPDLQHVWWRLVYCSQLCHQGPCAAPSLEEKLYTPHEPSMTVGKGRGETIIFWNRHPFNRHPPKSEKGSLERLDFKLTFTFLFLAISCCFSLDGCWSILLELQCF